MPLKLFRTSLSVALLLVAATATSPVLADSSELALFARGDKGPPGGKDKETSSPVPPEITSAKLQNWMHTEVQDAWNLGQYYGDGAWMTFVDDISSTDLLSGNLGDGDFSLHHGEWTSRQGHMIAYQSGISIHDFGGGDPEQRLEKFVSNIHADDRVTLKTGYLNILNLSYGYVGDANEMTNYNTGNLFVDREKSIIDYASSNSAFISKSAGNNGGSVVGGATRVIGPGGPRSLYDYLSLGLIDAMGDVVYDESGKASISNTNFSGVFVGALDGNSDVTIIGEQEVVNKQVNIASYSTRAGEDPRVYLNYLMVGVDATQNGNLNGTSFAAPIISGYAAILSSKFKTATPVQIKNQLLDTARTNTISGYDQFVHGQGEASIFRAVSPLTIN